MKAETKAFQELIKGANYAHRHYNLGNYEAAKHILRAITDASDALIHHIDNRHGLLSREKK